MDINISRLDIAELRSQHADLDKRLQRLARRKHPTPAEQQEMREIKRLKLAMKDRLSELQQAEAA